MPNNIPDTVAQRDRLEALDGKQTDFTDTGPRRVPGLALRVSPTGQKSWVITARRPGHKNPSRFALGDYRDFTLSEARDKALDFKRSLREGIDPLAERTANAAKAKAERLETIDELIEQFNQRCLEKNRSGAEQVALMNQDVLPFWRGRNINDITRKDVKAVVIKKKKTAPVRANRLLTLLKTFFTWAIEEEFLKENPAKDIKPVTQESERERVLDDNELQILWTATDKMGAPFGAITQLLMLSGQRRQEVAGMKWPEVDSEKMLWAIPAERSKNKKAHTLPLTQTMLDIINAQPKVAGSEYVFPSGRSPMTKHVSGYSKAKKRLDKFSSISDWTLHDLRRTAATNMARLRVPIHIIEMLLNHRSGTLKGVAKIYNRYDYLTESRSALEALDRLMLSIRNNDELVVVPLRPSNYG